MKILECMESDLRVFRQGGVALAYAKPWRFMLKQHEFGGLGKPITLEEAKKHINQSH